MHYSICVLHEPITVQGRQGMEEVNFQEKTIAATSLWPFTWISSQRLRYSLDTVIYKRHRLITHRWPKHSRPSLAENEFPWCGSALVQGIKYTVQGRRVVNFLYLCREFLKEGSLHCLKYALKFQCLNNLNSSQIWNFTTPLAHAHLSNHVKKIRGQKRQICILWLLRCCAKMQWFSENVRHRRRIKTEEKAKVVASVWG